MSPAAKNNTKAIVSIMVGVLTIASFAFSLGIGFSRNQGEHQVIQLEQKLMKADLETEIIRSKTVDDERSKSMHKVQTNQKVMQSQMGQQLNGQVEIKENIKEMSDDIKVLMRK